VSSKNSSQFLSSPLLRHASSFSIALFRSPIPPFMMESIFSAIWLTVLIASGGACNPRAFYVPSPMWTLPGVPASPWWVMTSRIFPTALFRLFAPAAFFLTLLAMPQPALPLACMSVPKIDYAVCPCCGRS